MLKNIRSIILILAIVCLVSVRSENEWAEEITTNQNEIADENSET